MFAQMNNDKLWKNKILFSLDFSNETFNIKTITSIQEWYWWKTEWGIKAMQNAEKDVNIPLDDIRIDNGEIQWFPIGLSDFAYVPFEARDIFISIGEWLGKHNVFLEIAFPMAIGNLHIKHGFEIQQLTLCTSEGQERHNPYKMYQKCKVDGRWPFGLIHPVKMGKHTVNFTEWDKWLQFEYFFSNQGT
eukprot:455101_1